MRMLSAFNRLSITVSYRYELKNKAFLLSSFTDVRFSSILKSQFKGRDKDDER